MITWDKSAYQYILDLRADYNIEVILGDVDD